MRDGDKPWPSGRPASLARVLEEFEDERDVQDLCRPAAITNWRRERVVPELIFGCGAGTLITVALADTS